MEEFLQHFADYDVFNWLFSIISFLAGAYVGHRFNIWQDKRKEFNQKRDEIFPLIKSEVENPEPMFEAITENQFEVLWWLMHPWQRKGFSESFVAYKTAQGGETKNGEWPSMFAYKDPEPVAQAAAKLLLYLKRR